MRVRILTIQSTWGKVELIERFEKYFPTRRSWRQGQWVDYDNRRQEWRRRLDWGGVGEAQVKVQDDSTNRKSKDDRFALEEPLQLLILLLPERHAEVRATAFD